MPPKVKFSKEEIVEVAYEIVRREGSNGLTARSLASALGVSTAPIFTAFENIGALTDAVTERAKEKYNAYIAEGLRDPIPFKGSGRAHIRFAKDEPMLFRFLFVDRGGDEKASSHYLPESNDNEPLVRTAAENAYGFGGEKAKHIYNHLSVYVHGLAMLYAFGQYVFDDSDIDKMLSEVFLALKERSEKEG